MDGRRNNIQKQCKCWFTTYSYFFSFPLFSRKASISINKYAPEKNSVHNSLDFIDPPLSEEIMIVKKLYPKTTMAINLQT
jgi:hypothetical protein